MMDIKVVDKRKLSVDGEAKEPVPHSTAKVIPIDSSPKFKRRDSPENGQEAS